MSQQGYCPACGQYLIQQKPNAAVKDFCCSACNAEFELKSSQKPFGKKVLDGAYNTMIERINSNNAPSFFFLSHNGKQVQNLFVTPSHFVTTSIIEKRRPLSNMAKRTNWIGCNILLNCIPSSGRIFYVQNESIIPRQEVQKKYQQTAFLQISMPINVRGWLLDILCCIDRLNHAEFTLNDLYKFEPYLSLKHPNNRNIRPKIRQQLQILRDMGYLSFLNKGHYKINHS